MSDVLLPRLREPNYRTAACAAAQLYHLAATNGPAAGACRCLMADSALVTQLLSLLSCPDPLLVHSVLAVLDVLSSVPACGTLMMREGWLDRVVPLLESRDGLVRRWAERALCSMYMGTAHV